MRRPRHRNELGGCPSCGSLRVKIRKDGAGNELSVECRIRSCSSREGRPTERARLFPQNVGSYIPEASWADKFRTHPNVSRVTE